MDKLSKGEVEEGNNVAKVTCILDLHPWIQWDPLVPCHTFDLSEFELEGNIYLFI